MINVWVSHKHKGFNTYPNFIPELFSGVTGRDNDEDMWWGKALGVKQKQIFKDKVDHTQDNIALIRTPCIGSYENKNYHNQEWTWDKHIFPLIEWCLDNHIKVAMDDSWETGSYWKRARGKLLDRQDVTDFIINNNIKIIANVPPIHDQFTFDNSHDDYFIDTHDFSKVYINADFFLYHTRQVHQRENYIFKMNTYPVPHKDKKYLFCCLFGDITKRSNALLYAQLLKNNLIDEKVFVSTIMGRKDPQSLTTSQYYLPLSQNGVWNRTMRLSHEIINWMNKDEKNILKIYQHSPFERNYHNVYNEKKIGNLRERRIPQELYNSHFAINVETSMHPWFFTEKTYKNIIAKIPYLAFGGHYHSAGLKKHLQFERFEEIFDYTAEETPPQNSHPFLIIKGISDNIERLRKEPLSIFDQPTVKEKLDHNESMFYKLSTTDELRTHIERVMDEILYA